MSEEKKVNRYVREYGQFRNTHTCSNSDVEEKEFKKHITVAQCLRDLCSAKGEIALCEQCEFYTNKKEFISKKNGETRVLYSGSGSDPVSPDFELAELGRPIM